MEAPRTQDRFGAAVRARRAELGITLEQLAAASGVSQGSLSKIERGAMGPSLHSAVAIAASLGSDLTTLTAPESSAVIVRRGEEQAFIDPATGIRRALLARPAPGVEVIHYTLPARTVTADFAPHPARTVETFYVEAGVVEVVADGETVRLDAGDAAQLRGDRFHRIENVGPTAASLLLVTTIPR